MVNPYDLPIFSLNIHVNNKIFLISREERHSNDPQIQRKFTEGAIVNTISQYLDKLNPADGAPYSPSSRYDDSDSDSDFNLSSRSSPSRFSGFKGSARTSSLTYSATSSTKKKKKKKVCHTNRIKVDVKNPLASLVIPNGLKTQELFRMHMYEAGIKAAKKDPHKIHRWYKLCNFPPAA